MDTFLLYSITKILMEVIVIRIYMRYRPFIRIAIYMYGSSIVLNVSLCLVIQWSYGVVLWELLTRGVNPYPEVDNWDILKYLKTGRRMTQPSFCPEEM